MRPSSYPNSPAASQALDPLAGERCPASGLSLKKPPAWQNIPLTSTYRVSFSLVGDQILHTRPVGQAGRSGMPLLFEKRRAVLEEAGLWESDYCEIKDYSNISLRHPRMSRTQFTELISAEYERGAMRGYWGYGGPRVFRWIMASAKALSPHPEGPVYYVSSYATAVQEALAQLHAPELTLHHQSPPRRTIRDGWSVAVGGYHVEIEVWDDHILFAKARGRLGRTAAAHLLDLLEQIVTREGVCPDGSFAQISDLSMLRQVNLGALRYMHHRYVEIHSRHPCRGVVILSPRRSVHAVARIANAALPFPYLVAQNLDDALRLVRSLPYPDAHPSLLSRLRGQTAYSRADLSRRVSSLIQYAARIDWYTSGIEDPLVDPADPLAPIYALLRVLKLDFDTMLEDREKMQAEMLQAAKLSSIGLLTAGMAHELNSPLTAVLGYTEHIQRSSSDPGSADQAGRAAKCALRMRDIIDQLAAYSRTDPDSPPVPTDLNLLIEESLGLIDPLLEKNNVVVHRELAPDLPLVLCSPTALQSVIYNLLTNSFDAYSAGRPQSAGGDPNPVVITTRRIDTWVELLCTDQGAGMSPKAQERAFDPFFTTKDVGEGTGLGLFVTHRIVTGMGGTIHINSTPGKGTVVQIRLPAHLASSAEPPASG